MEIPHPKPITTSSLRSPRLILRLTACNQGHTIRRMGVPGPAIGALLGRYRIVEQIGHGGMGLVFRARGEQLDRDVAVKILPPGTFPGWR